MQKIASPLSLFQTEVLRLRVYRQERFQDHLRCTKNRLILREKPFNTKTTTTPDGAIAHVKDKITGNVVTP